MPVRALCVLVASVLAGSLGVGAAAAAPAPRYDALVVVSNPFGSPPAGPVATRIYQAPQISVSSADDEHFASSGEADGRTSSVSFTPPEGRTFTPGASWNLLGTRSTSGGAAVVTFGDTTCQPSGGGFNHGSFHVYEAATTADGALTTFSASYTVRCDLAVFSGLIRFHSRRGWSAIRTADETPDIGTVQLGQSAVRPVPFTVVGQGSEPITGPAVYGPAGTSIDSTTCGDTVDVGDQCVLNIRFAPRVAGPANLFLVFDSDEWFRDVQIGVTATGIDTTLGTYYPTGGVRVLDTRTDTGAHRGALTPGASVVVRPNIPGAQPSGYVLNLTAVTPSASGYLTAYPTGKPVPGTASLNVTAGRTVAHLITVPSGTDDAITIRNAAGTTHVVADLVGWYSSDSGPLEAGEVRGGGFHQTGVQRLLDTRAIRPLPAHQYVTVSARYPGRHVAALAVNITVTAPTASGYVTAWGDQSDHPPLTSTLNFSRGETVSNTAIVQTTACSPATGCNDSATIAVANGSGGPLHVIVDITGYFDDGTTTADVRFRPLPSPTRVVDTRQSLGTDPFLAGETHSFQPSAVGPDTVALDGDVTAVRPSTSTYLVLWPDIQGYQLPRTSSVNAASGQIGGNHVIASVGGPDGDLNVYNYAGRVDVVADVDGTFDVFPPSPPQGIQEFRDRTVPTSDSPVAPVMRPTI